MKFLIYFLLEVWLLIVLGNYFGATTTILWIITSALLGLWLLKNYGFYHIREISNSGFGSNISNIKMAENFLRVISYLLLIIPGFLSDFIALLLLLPFIKNILLARVFKNVVDTGNNRQYNKPSGRIFDSNFKELDE